GTGSPASPARLPRPEHGAGTRPLHTRHTIRHSRNNVTAPVLEIKADTGDGFWVATTYHLYAAAS
ncbi:hypothetical protein ABT060_41505, partial [Streptomyces sp. NPDC002722]